MFLPSCFFVSFVVPVFPFAFYPLPFFGVPKHFRWRTILYGFIFWSHTVPELRKDPIVGRWVIISTDRAKRPTDFFARTFRPEGRFLSLLLWQRGQNSTRNPGIPPAERWSAGPAQHAGLDGTRGSK